MTDEARKINGKVTWLHERAQAFNLAYIKRELLSCANEIERLEETVERQAAKIKRLTSLLDELDDSLQERPHGT